MFKIDIYFKHKKYSFLKKMINDIDEKKEGQNNQDSTFNRLRELQTLLKKESALKELCKNIIFNKKFSY